MDVVALQVCKLLTAFSRPDVFRRRTRRAQNSRARRRSMVLVVIARDVIVGESMGFLTALKLEVWERRFRQALVV